MHRKLLLGLVALIGIGLGIAMGVSGGVILSAVAAPTPSALETLVKPNSCVIHCPKASPNPELAGAVGCADGTTAVCQCGDSTRRMAYCEIRSP